ncbi:MAG: histidine--tRNA ligase [Desulfobacterales bacterium]
MIQLIRGFKDILPPESDLWHYIEKTAVTLFQDFGFKEIRIPVLEHTELFARSIGEHTDIVEKEMYTFPDRKGEMITMRPEATASVVRAYIQHKLYAGDPVKKLYTLGPMFRRERPQKGRYRQFYQINAEVFGIASPLIDAQIIFMLMTFFNRLRVSDLYLQLNSLGCPRCRPGYRALLSEYLTDKVQGLCEDCKIRSQKNPLRVLDCKVPGCIEAMQNAPTISDHLCHDCFRHFDAVKTQLAKQDIPFVLNRRLVRGLDYYTRTTFEIQTGRLGAQSAVAGGGRYDGLVGALGGPDQPAVGFAVGFDRLAELLQHETEDHVRHPGCYIAALDENSRELAYEWLCTLSEAGIQTDMDYDGRSLKSQMKRADRLKAAYVLILGENELLKGKAVLRNMSTKSQEEIPLAEVVRVIEETLKGDSSAHPTNSMENGV